MVVRDAAMYSYPISYRLQIRVESAIAKRAKADRDLLQVFAYLVLRLLLLKKGEE